MIFSFQQPYYVFSTFFSMSFYETKNSELRTSLVPHEAGSQLPTQNSELPTQNSELRTQNSKLSSTPTLYLLI